MVTNQLTDYHAQTEIQTITKLFLEGHTPHFIVLDKKLYFLLALSLETHGMENTFQQNLDNLRFSLYNTAFSECNRH